MKAEQTGNILLLKFLCLVVRGASNHAYTGQPPKGCPHIQTMSCGTTTLENGESVAMVPKSLSQEEAWWMHNIAELEGVENRLICSKPDCISNPCVNGGTCQETLTGFECQCTPDFYGITCSCNLIHTPDVSDTRRYTFPGLSIAPGVTSFDFEVSADNDVHIGLSRSNATEDYMYEMAIGGWGNTGGGIRRCIYTYGGGCDWNTLRQNDPAAVGLSRIPAYDHYQISFADGNIRLCRYDNQELLMEYHDPNPLEVNFIGIWTGFGSEGYWKFPSLCYDK